MADVESSPAAETCGSSRAASDATADRASFAGTSSCWNAPAGTGSNGLGTREPAETGRTTRARAAVSTDPTTHLGGRTRREPYHRYRVARDARDLPYQLRVLAHAPRWAGC